MSAIQWNDDLSVGVKLIDHQHQALITIANRIVDAAAQGAGPAIINGLVKKLREYTVFHFNSEEELMERIRYPKRGDQEREHTRLKQEVKDYQRQLYQREDVTPDEVKEFVIDWFFEHILTYDRELAEFIKANPDSQEGKVVDTGVTD